MTSDGYLIVSVLLVGHLPPTHTRTRNRRVDSCRFVSIYVNFLSISSIYVDFVDFCLFTLTHLFQVHVFGLTWSKISNTTSVIDINRPELTHRLASI